MPEPRSSTPTPTPPRARPPGSGLVQIAGAIALLVAAWLLGPGSGPRDDGVGRGALEPRPPRRSTGSSSASDAVRQHLGSVGAADDASSDDSPVAPAEMLRLGTVAGRVVDVSGNPVSDARIAAHVRYAAAGPLGSSRVAPLRAGPAVEDGRLPADGELAVSGAAGDFEIGVTGVPPVAAGDRLVDLVVTAEGFAACESCRLWVPLGGRIDDVTLVLLRAGSLSGRVVDDVGRPVPGVDVVVRPFDDTRLGVERDDPAAADARSDPDGATPDPRRGHAVSDELGRFVVSGLPEGAVWVGVRDAGWEHLEPERVHVVHPDSVTRAGDVVVAPRD